MKKLLFFIILVIAAYFVWRWWHSPDAASADRGQKLVYDRLWVDHVPKSETDTIQLFVAITEEPLGIFQQTSSWRGSFELFRYEPAGDGKATLLYPQTKEKERVAYRAAACSEKGFDFCLELSGASRGTKRYFSQKGWEVGGKDFRAHAAELVHSLPLAP